MSSSSHNNTPTTASSQPKLIADPRFLAGRKLVGEFDAVEIFSTLLAQARQTYDADDVETIPGYYEYGNALLRSWQRGKDDIETVERRDSAAAAAEKRRQESKPAATTPSTSCTGEEQQESTTTAATAKPSDSSNDPEDLTLALEMMETAWSILDEELTTTTRSESSSTTDAAAMSHHHPYAAWMHEQRPRILTGLGDLLVELKRPADAADAYLRALQHRQDILQAALQEESSSNVLPARRHVVEANILVTEALLECRPTTEAVVTTETETQLVPAGQVLEYARGYYDKARDELQEVVVLLGQLAAAKENVDGEKEMVCHLATMVMGAGEALAQMDGEEEGLEPEKKKAKT